MNKALVKLFFLISIVLLALLLTSCELPWISDEPTESPLNFTPRPNTETEAVEPQQTATPECVTVGDPANLPTIGTVLRWMDNSNFLYIPEGEFVMGAASTEPEDYNPQHVVFLDDFWMQEAEVTNQQYTQCVEAGRCTPPYEEEEEPYRYADPAYGAYPVVGVDWQQAKDYCTYIEARLPSEAEWEKVARGPEGSPFPWGVDEPTCDLLNYDDCLEPSEPANVLSYEDGQSLYKVWDLSGNVFEWVNDWYQEDYYYVSPAVNPYGPAEGLQRVYRGGSFKTTEEEILSWMRFNLEPEKHSEEIGFRCALDGPEIKCDTLTSSNVTVHPPPCQVPAVNVNQPEAQPTFTPFPPCDLANFAPFCEWRHGHPISGINIWLENCYENQISNIAGNGVELDCTVTQGNPPVYRCNPPIGSAQGSVIEFSYCYTIPPVQITKECPAGYEYDPYTSFCEPIGPFLPEPPCPGSYVEDDDFGCLPDPGCGCPAGFFMITDRCIPIDQCLWPGNPPCEEPVCAEGEVYDPQNECCVIPETLKPVCPAGLMYFEEYQSCMFPYMLPFKCSFTSVTLPYCPTPTPTPPPIDCYAIQDPQICENNGCTWECSESAVAAPICSCVP